MSAAPDLPRDHLIGIAEWDALPEDVCARYELVEGVPHVSPRATPRHQDVGFLLSTALNAALPAEWRAVMDVEVCIEGGPTPTLRAPDVSVVRKAVVDHRPRVDPADVLAVVEIHSPGTRRVDRMHKLAEYAEAGIAHYALVEPGPPVTLTELVLEAGVYRMRAEHRGATTIDLGVAAPVDLDALDGTVDGAAASNEVRDR